MSKLQINEKFTPLFEQPNGVRYYVVTGGRGSSKSFSISLWNCLKTFEQNSKTLYTRYTLISAKKSIIPEFEEKIEILGAESHFLVNNNDITNIETGSSILFSGIKTSSGNQTANLKSLQGVSVWILDEAEELVDEGTFDKIDLSIRSKQSKNIVILILNPTTKEHWIYKRFFESRGIQGGWNGIKDDTCYIHTTYLDNLKNLSDSYIRSLNYIKESNPEKFEHVVLGGWRAKAEGVIFKYEIGKFDDTLQYYYGLDFGFVTDPDACIKVAINEKNKTIYLHEEFYVSGQKLDDISHQINNLDKGVIVADSAESRLIADLETRCQRSIIRVKKGAGSIMDGIKLMQNYKIIITPESTNLAIELNNYAWNGKANEKPIDLYNHLIDAARYVVYTFANNKQPEQIIDDSTNAKFNKGIATGHDAAPWQSQRPHEGGKGIYS